MSQRLELFQKLVTIPNAPNKALPEHIRDCLRSFEGAPVQIQGDTASLIVEGRREYLELLAARARHFWARSRPVGVGIATRTSVGLTAMQNEEVRDFFHDAYYVAFYVARYAIVSLGFYDCTSHDNYDGLLNQVAGDSALTQDQSDKVLSIKACLSQQKPYRNDADYVFGNARLSNLGNKQLVQDAIDRIDSILADWSIP